MTHLNYVLLIDDNIEDRELLEHAFKRNGYLIKVSHVAGCFEAVEFLSSAASTTLDLIILDWKMPKLSGLDCLIAIRKVPSASETPVVVLSGIISPLDVQKGKELGVVCFLPKPYGHAKYTATLKKIMTLKCDDKS